jgi:hypothetical protein
MNWLGFDARAMSGAILGCALAVLLGLHDETLRAFLPWSTGLVAGLGCAALARDRNGPRGLVVGALATWTAALADAVMSQSARGLPEAISVFHTTLTPSRVLAYVLGFAVAVWVGGRSLRRGAAQRIAGA